MGREKNSIGRREGIIQRLRICMRPGEKFVWEKSNGNGCLKLFHRQWQTSCWKRQMSRWERERLAIVRPEREVVEEEGSGRGNLGRNKAVITLVPQLTGQLVKSRGLLSLFLSLSATGQKRIIFWIIFDDSSQLNFNRNVNF